MLSTFRLQFNSLQARDAAASSLTMVAVIGLLRRMSPLQLSTVLAILSVALLALIGRIPYIVEFQPLWRRAVAALLLTEILAIATFLPVTTPPMDALELQRAWFPQLFFMHVVLVFFLFLWWRLRADVSIGRFLSISSANLGEKVKQGFWYGVGCWLFAVAATATVGNLTESAAGHGSSAAVPEIVLWMARLPLTQKLAIVAVSMTVEEAFYRGFLQPRIGLVATSILFALGHFSYDLPLLVVGVFVVSLVIGRCFERTNDLIPCMVAHGIFNGVQLLVVLPIVVETWGSSG